MENNSNTTDILSTKCKDMDKILQSTLDYLFASNTLVKHGGELSIFNERINMIGGVVFESIDTLDEYKVKVATLQEYGFKVKSLVGKSTGRYRAVGVTYNKEVYDKYLESLGIETIFKVKYTYDLNTIIGLMSADPEIYIVNLTKEVYFEDNRDCGFYERKLSATLLGDKYKSYVRMLGSVVIKGGKIGTPTLNINTNLYLIDTDIEDDECVIIANRSSIIMKNCKVPKYAIYTAMSSIISTQFPKLDYNTKSQITTDISEIQDVIVNRIGFNREDRVRLNRFRIAKIDPEDDGDIISGTIEINEIYLDQLPMLLNGDVEYIGDTPTDTPTQTDTQTQTNDFKFLIKPGKQYNSNGEAQIYLKSSQIDGIDFLDRVKKRLEEK